MGYLVLFGTDCGGGFPDAKIHSYQPLLEHIMNMLVEEDPGGQR